MRLNDAALGVLVAALGALLLVASLQLPGVPGQDYGAGFFPAILGGATVLAGAGLLLGGLRRPGAPLVTLPPWLRDGWAVTNVAILAGAIALFAAAGDRIGFLPFAAALLWLVQWRLGTPALRAALIAIPGALLFRFLFATVLRVPLPPGVLEGWL